MAAGSGIIFTPTAEDNLRQLFDYLSAYSLDGALLQVERILNKTEQLLSFPRMGTVIPEIANERCREILIGSYRVAYYIVSEDRIDILSIHHSGRP